MSQKYAETSVFDGERVGRDVLLPVVRSKSAALAKTAETYSTESGAGMEGNATEPKETVQDEA